MFRTYLLYRRLAGNPSALSRYADTSLAEAGLSPWSGSSRSRAGAKLNATRKEAMSWSAIQARWDEYKVAAKRRWDRLSEQQLHNTRGNREYLAKRVQVAYATTGEEAERQIRAWQAGVLARKAAGTGR